MTGRLALIWALHLAACGAPPGPASAPTAALPGASAAVLRASIDGWSGLGLGPAARLWAVAERDHMILPVGLDGAVGTPLAVSGLPATVDLESMAWTRLGCRGAQTWGCLLALGLETGKTGGAVMLGGRACDVGLFRRSEHGGLRLERCLSFPYKLWGLTAEANRGMEGLCQAGGKLVASLETPFSRAGQRRCALAVYDLARQTWTGHDLALTSTTQQRGKLSALECRPGPDGTIQALAVERHFTVGRLLRFSIPAGGARKLLRPRVLLDLHRVKPAGAKGIPNYEGLAWLPDGRVALINDNQYGGRQGDTLLVLLPASAAR